MIYGANGFTGRLIAQEARRRGLAPVLAGRSSHAVRALGQELGLESRTFDLSNPAATERQLADIRVVLHCAGPFSATQQPMLSACIARGVHYLDITGEIPAFEHLHSRANDAAQAGITAVSGVGFDVVPTDGVAALLADALPSATRLRLAFLAGAVSRGTAITALEIIERGGMSRQQGLILREPVATRTWSLEHHGRQYTGASIPWGDVATAYYSTGIPTIETYMALPASAAMALRALYLAAPLLRVPAVRETLRQRASRAKGPTEEQLRRDHSIVWGEVTDAVGQRRTAKLIGPEAYAWTVEAALAAVNRVMTGSVPAGALTPSQAFGKGFVTTLPNTKLILDSDES